MDTDFKVKVGEFEGPLTVLLDLIEKRKLHISDVSLSEVADEFIEYTRSFENFPIGDSADFILVASTLLLIKSKSLLPNMPLTEEEQGSIEDLENRLALYKKHKDLSLNLGRMFGNFLYFAQEKRGMRAVFAPTPEITLSALESALNNALKNMPPREQSLPKIAVQKIISLEEMIERLTERMKQSIATNFSSFAKAEKGEKINVIVSFLAMLELVKRGLVRVEQKKHFEDISIEANEVGVPRY